MDTSDLVSRFRYHAPDDEKIVKYSEVRNMGLDMAMKLNTMLPEGRDKALAMTKLEEAVFHANAAIARN